MATGSTTSNQWKAAADAATEAAYKADIDAFNAEQAVVEARGNVFKAQLALESATAQGNPAAAAAAKQQLAAAQNSVITSQSNASQVRQQSDNANAAAEAAEAKASANASSPLSETTPPPASANPGNPTSYQNIPATVTPVTSPSPNPVNESTASSVTSVTVSRSQTTTVENTTGGGSVTTVSTPAIATPQSTALQQQADVAQKQADLLSLNPNTAFGQRALDRKLADGSISQEQYNYVKGLSNEERIAAKNAELNKAIELQTEANSAKIQPPPTVTTTPNLNTTEVSVTNIQVSNVSQTTTINGEVSGYGVTTEVIDGETYQVTTNADGSLTYTTSDGSSVTEDEEGYTALKEPPSTADEFDGIDQQVADNENGLQEPPQLSDEEVDAYLQPGGGADEVIREQEQAEADARQDDEAYQRSLEEYVESEPPESGGGATGALNKTRSDATNKDAVSFEKAKDWRVRLSLAPSAKYLYKADNPGILKALQATNGVIFPYTPTVSVVYAANYDASELIHSNYKIYNYKYSNVDTVSITGDFTAQDTTEANYLLAVIHFFKSATKMFYGQDQNPRNGTPPPLVYMSGMGTFQFDNHPLAITNFTYSLPNEVDYIRVGSVTTEPGSSTSGQNTVNNSDNASSARIQSSGLGPKVPNFQRQQSTINSDATYVPTKMQIAITCMPIVTRNDISNNFSLEKYATGALMQGSKRNGGGIW